MNDDLLNEKTSEKVKDKPSRASRFASKMAKKRSALDNKLSKMKSKLRDVESRKKVHRDKNINEDTDYLKEKISDKQTKKGLKRENKNEIMEKPLKSTTMKNLHDEDKSESAEIQSKKENELFLKSKQHSDETIKQESLKPSASRDTGKENKNTADVFKKDTAPIKPAKPLAKSISQQKTAASIGGRGGKKIKPSALLKKIIDQLDESTDLKFVSVYRDNFLKLLKNLHNHKLSIAWYCENLPAELDSNQKSILLYKHEALAGQLKIDNQRRTLDTYVEYDAIGSLLISTWGGIRNFTPLQVGQIRKSIDIHIIQCLPDETEIENFFLLLERTTRQSGSIIICPLNLKSKVEKLKEQFEINRNYTVINNDCITYHDFDFANNNLNALHKIFQDEESLKIICDFSLHRQIMFLANLLEAVCDKEIKKLELVDDLRTPSELDDRTVFSLSELDGTVKKLQTNAKLLLGAQGIEIDDLGQVNFSATLNEVESAQALISELSIENLVREDELDTLNFSAEQRRSINRIKRFRFASKLGFLWKLNPQYVEKLYQSTYDVLINHAQLLYKQTTSIVEKHLNEMERFANGLPKNSKDYNSYKHFKSSWLSHEHLLSAISNLSSLNHFRSAVFSKKGNAAPLETQSGVLRELRESRMFVSQLMAFGMLGAVLLGSTYAVEVFINWFSGGPVNVGEELTQAAKSSRGLGRQVRILIMGIAGVCIIFYLLMRIYLKNSERILDQQRIVNIYSQQLEDVIAKFIAESSSLTKQIITADLDRLQLNYEKFRNGLPDHIKDINNKRPGFDGSKGSGLSQSSTIKRIEGLKKWLNSILSERDSFSIIQNQKALIGEAQKSLGQ